MRILVIDDLRNLRDDFAADHEVVIARTSKDGLDALNGGTDFDMVFFDHDLGGDDTARPVVAFLEEKSFFNERVNIGHCVVHTSNISGGDWIMSGLKAAGYMAQRVYAGDYFTA